MIELEALWAKALRQLVDLAAHDMRNAMNGVSVNFEVLRSRIDAGRTEKTSLESFSNAAHGQFEAVMARMGGHLYLARIPSDPADVALTLKHMATFILPTVAADGITLTIEGYDVSSPTGAPHVGVRLALASGLLALIKEGGGKCTLERQPETVVRFSHESAGAVSLDPEVTSALGKHGIKSRRSPEDLQIVFP